MNFSKQRESILDYLKNTNEHPTAERIYTDLKQTLPNLSLATVYRNCNQLWKAGLIVKLATDGKTDHFDANTSDHQHFVCTLCDRVSDLFFKLPDEMIEGQLGEGFCADSYQLYVYGTCSDCRAHQKRS